MPACVEHAGQALGLGGAGPHDHAQDARRDLVEGALRLQLAERHDDRVVDGLGHLGQQVRGDQHRAALPGQVAHEVTQPGDPLRVEPVGWLVEDEDVGVADERGGQLQALAHAHGEATDLALGVARQADQLEHLVGARLVVAAGPRRHAQVGPGAPRRVEAGRFEHGTDGRGRVLEVLVVAPGDGGRPGGGVHQAEQHAQGRRLPRAVGAEEAGDAPGLDGEREVVDGQHFPEVFGQPVDLDGKPAGGGAGGHRGRP